MLASLKRVTSQLLADGNLSSEGADLQVDREDNLGWDAEPPKSTYIARSESGDVSAEVCEIVPAIMISEPIPVREDVVFDRYDAAGFSAAVSWAPKPSANHLHISYRAKHRP